MVTNSRREVVNLSVGEILRRMYSMSKKELVLRAIRGEAVERIPVGFWLHYVTQEEKELGLDNSAVVEKVLRGTNTMLKKFPQILSRL